jgi:hypothetical protein
VTDFLPSDADPRHRNVGWWDQGIFLRKSRHRPHHMSLFRRKASVLRLLGSAADIPCSSKMDSLRNRVFADKLIQFPNRFSVSALPMPESIHTSSLSSHPNSVPIALPLIHLLSVV